MYYYKVFGYIFRCAYEIKQLYAVPPTEHFDVDIILHEMPEEIVQTAKAQTIFPCIGWTDRLFWMHNNYGILAVYQSGKIYAKSVSDKDTFYLLQYVLGYGIAMYAHLQGRITLHCGCVAINNRCVIITGDSGAGKSTLTHTLITDGATMLSDDVVAIDYSPDGVPLVYPAFPQQKICRDAALKQGYRLEDLLYVDPEKDKFAVLHTDCFSSDPYPLHSVFHLSCSKQKDEASFSDGLIVEPLEGFAKVNVLLDNLYLCNVIPKTGLSAQAFQLCVDTVKDKRVFNITRLQGKDTLQAIKQVIYSTAQN